MLGCEYTEAAQAPSSDIDVLNQPVTLAWDMPDTNDDAVNYLPTPLDPYAVKLAGGALYTEAAKISLRARVLSMCQAAGVPEPYFTKIVDEIEKQITIRCSHNSVGYERLYAAVHARRPSAAMLETIQDARAGVASFAELVALIAEYPEMTSVETHKLTLPFSQAQLAELDTQVQQQLMDLQKAGRAVIGWRNPEGGDFGSWQFLDDTGVLVQKRVAAEVNTPGNRFELIRKATVVLLADDVELVDVQSNLQLVTLPSGEELFINAQPLSVSYYLRSYDYKDRLNYHERSADFHPIVGAKAVAAALADYDVALIGQENAKVLLKIPDKDARDTVYASLIAGLEKH